MTIEFLLTMIPEFQLNELHSSQGVLLVTSRYHLVAKDLDLFFSSSAGAAVLLHLDVGSGHLQAGVLRADGLSLLLGAYAGHHQFGEVSFLCKTTCKLVYHEKTV